MIWLIASNSSKNGCFLIDFSIGGQNDTINIQKWMKSTIQFWMASTCIQNWMTLIIQIWKKVTVVNIIQNWMILMIQIWMKVTVVNIIQNWMTLIVQIQMKVTVVNNIQNWMTLIVQIRMKVTVVNIMIYLSSIFSTCPWCFNTLATHLQILMWIYNNVI